MKPLSRRKVMGAGIALGTVTLAALVARRVRSRVAAWTTRPEFLAAPPAPVHDPARDRRTLYVGRGEGPARNVDTALAKLGGIASIVGEDDLVIVKVAAQWWNQGMTNVAAVRRVIEHVLERPGFRGEIVVFENVHFRLADGSGLARAWTRPSERNVDVAGWDKLGDLIPHFAQLGAPVSFVGLVDGGRSELSGDAWHDPTHAHGVYGGDGRGPIAPGDPRDGYHWDFARAFRVRRSLVDDAAAPLTWPRFTSPRSGLVIDFKDGVLRREAGRLAPARRKLTYLNLTTVNEHSATGMTGACKSAMGIVDMSAGRLGTDPRGRDFLSVHYFGYPHASWRMAGPLAHFANEVRAPDLVISVAEWCALTPEGPWTEAEDIRMSARSAHRVGAVVAGVDPVAIDAWCTRNLLHPRAGAGARSLDLDDPNAQITKFLRYFREIRGSGTLDPALVRVA